MSYEKSDEREEPLHEDPVQNLRIENEILAMKIRAQYGGTFHAGSGLSPEVENRFLKNVLEFEERIGKCKPVKIYDSIGRPDYIKAALLPPERVEQELARIVGLLAEKGITIDFLRPRDALFRYRFITEELFWQETWDVSFPGMMKCYLYEEFHPDHEIILRHHTATILSAWLNRKLGAMPYHLCRKFMVPDGGLYAREDALVRLQKALDQYAAFEHSRYSIDAIGIFPKPAGMPLQAMAQVEGTMKYVAILKNGERKTIEGPYRVYYACEKDCWQSFFFYLPGYILKT